MRAYLDAYEETLLAVSRYEEQVRNGTLKAIPMDKVMKELHIDKTEIVD